MKGFDYLIEELCIVVIRERGRERESEREREAERGRGREDKSQKGCMISAENVKKIFDKNNSEPQPNNSSSKLVRIEIIY